MDPLSIVYSWQALLIALTASALTQFVKRCVDILIGIQDNNDGTLSLLERAGAELRKDSVVIQGIVMPALPLLFGAVAAIILPVRPEVLMEYAAKYVHDQNQVYLIYAAWGAACGQFCDYVFTKVKTLASLHKENNEG